MFVNIIKSYRDVVAVCDKELLGKRFEEDVEGIIRQLDVKESFYKGSEEPKPLAEDKVFEIMQKMVGEDATFNVVGEKSVAVAIKSGVITREIVEKIEGIPFALVLL